MDSVGNSENICDLFQITLIAHVSFCIPQWLESWVVGVKIISALRAATESGFFTEYDCLDKGNLLQATHGTPLQKTLKQLSAS